MPLEIALGFGLHIKSIDVLHSGAELHAFDTNR